MCFISGKHLMSRQDQGRKERSILIKNRGKIRIRIIFSGLNFSKSSILCIGSHAKVFLLFTYSFMQQIVIEDPLALSWCQDPKQTKIPTILELTF